MCFVVPVCCGMIIMHPRCKNINQSKPKKSRIKRPQALPKKRFIKPLGCGVFSLVGNVAFFYYPTASVG